MKNPRKLLYALATMKKLLLIPLLAVSAQAMDLDEAYRDLSLRVGETAKLQKIAAPLPLRYERKVWGPSFNQVAAQFKSLDSVRSAAQITGRWTLVSSLNYYTPTLNDPAPYIEAGYNWGRLVEDSRGEDGTACLVYKATMDIKVLGEIVQFDNFSARRKLDASLLEQQGALMRYESSAFGGLSSQPNYPAQVFECKPWDDHLVCATGEARKGQDVSYNHYHIYRRANDADTAAKHIDLDPACKKLPSLTVD